MGLKLEDFLEDNCEIGGSFSFPLYSKNEDILGGKNCPMEDVLHYGSNRIILD